MLNALLFFGLTVAVYLLAKRIYASSGKVYTSPLIITPVLMIIFLLITGITYDSYNAGGKWLTDLLQPATMAFAIPLHKNFKVLKSTPPKLRQACCQGR